MPMKGIDVKGYARTTKSGKVIQVKQYRQTRDLSALLKVPGRPAISATGGQYANERSLPLTPAASASYVREQQTKLKAAQQVIKPDQPSKQKDFLSGVSPKERKAKDQAKAQDTSKASRVVESQRHAVEVLSRASEAEGDVSKVLQDVVQRAGGHMSGFQNRLKLVDRVAKKIRDKSASKQVPMEQYAGEIADALRYTAIVDADRNIEAGKAILSQLEAKGHSTVSIENTWSRGDAYSGININMRAPNGLVWELQLHTEESIAVKSVIHPKYAIERDPDNSFEERAAAYHFMVRQWEDVKQPAGWEGFGEQIYRPDAGYGPDPFIPQVEDPFVEPVGKKKPVSLSEAIDALRLTYVKH